MLNEAEKMQLVSLAGSSNWDLIRRVMYDIIERQIVKHFTTDPADTEAIIASFRIVAGSINTVQNVVRTVEFSIQEHINAVKDKLNEQEVRELLTEADVMQFVNPTRIVIGHA